jgi:hypothetical protein
MNIGLIDVDSHNFPNLALMKISQYHKKQDNNVEFVNLFNTYDIVYQSKIFDFSADYNYIPQTKILYKGGTGYSLDNTLDSVIENTYPDYSLYPQFTEAYGFLTRGCPRNCGFCIVSKKEGQKSCKVANLDAFWSGQKEIKLLDPNILASLDRKELLQQLIESNAWIDFTQGLDARLLNDEICEMLGKIKTKMLHFAWDSMGISESVIKGLELFKKYTKLNYRKLKAYVLTNYDTTLEADLYRIYKLKEIGYDPYVMVYDKQNAPQEVRRLQRWVNNKIIFNSCERFENYIA